MSADNPNTEGILRSRCGSSDATTDICMDYPIPPPFGQVKPRIRHHQDMRGSLFALNFPELPFKCRRIFVVTDTPEGMTRGKHAHYKTEQVLLCISGQIEIKFDRIFSENTVVLTPGMSVFHSAMEWAEIKFVEANSVLLSACSTDFDPDDYIGVYTEFQALVLRLNQDQKKMIAAQEQLLKEELIPTIDGPIPLLDLKANYAIVKDEVDAAIHAVLDSGHYINGPAVQTFESQFAMFVGTKHCVGVSNGTDAIVLALQALGVGLGDEIILQGNAFIADAMAIDHVGAKMVFVDHDDCFQLNLDLLQAAITEKTKAVLVVHMYGSCCDMTRLAEMCRDNQLQLIEDCAHAHGASWRGENVGSFGDVSTWSFYPAKNLGAYGDAGGLTTDRDDVVDRLRLLKNYGSERKYISDSKGLNHRMDTIHAAVLSVKLQYVLQWNRRRQEVAALYRSHLHSVGDISFPLILEDCVAVHHQFVICTGRRDALVLWLKEKYKIDVIIHYPVPIYKQKCFSEEFGSASDMLPRSTSSCDTILSLPMCPMMTDAMAVHVVTAVRSFFVETD